MKPILVGLHNALLTLDMVVGKRAGCAGLSGRPSQRWPNRTSYPRVYALS